MKYAYCLVALLLSGMFTTLSGTSTDPVLEITYPQKEMIVYEEELVSVVVSPQHEAVDEIVMTTDSSETYKTRVSKSRSHYCHSFMLHLGENIIDIAAMRDGKVMKSYVRKVYVTSKVYKEFHFAPEVYEKSFLHTDAQEKVCSKCHDMSVNEIPGTAFEDVSKSNCFLCHVKINFKKFAHAPSVNWLCTSCHNGKAGSFNAQDANKTKFLVADPVEPICLDCHDKKAELWKNKRFHHEPADSGRCNKCHNPHASDNNNYLRKPAWDLCTGCHKDKIDGAHVVKTFGRKMHPTHKVKDPSSKQGDELSCVSCHNPHVSNAPFLLQSDTLMSLCSRCHKK